VPTREEATNTFLWRERDATKNSISMAALPNENDDLAGDALHKRISVRVRQMEEVSRPPPTP